MLAYLRVHDVELTKDTIMIIEISNESYVKIFKIVSSNDLANSFSCPVI